MVKWVIAGILAPETGGAFMYYTLEQIRNILSCGDEFERTELAQELVNYPISIAEPVLLQLLQDEDELVRVNTCDSLSISNSLDTRNLLLKIAVSGRYLSRGYAILSATDITVRNKFDGWIMRDFLHKRLKQERSTWVRVAIYTALYQLGEKKYIEDLIALLDNRYYQIRCTVVHSLENIVHAENSDFIQNALRKRFAVENSVAVRSTMKASGLL